MLMTYNECLTKYKNDYQIRRALEAGLIIKLEPGIYSDKNFEFETSIISKKYPHAVFTMRSAFYYLGLTDMMRANDESGYTGANLTAKVCQDIVLKAIAESNLNRNVTIKGGVVMREITGDVRRATQDMDIDFIRYSLSDQSIDAFIDKLNVIEGVSLLINSKEQMFSEKLRSLLKFGAASTRFKDIFDIYYLKDKVSKGKLRKCFEEYILNDPGFVKSGETRALLLSSTG